MILDLLMLKNFGLYNQLTSKHCEVLVSCSDKVAVISCYKLS